MIEIKDLSKVYKLNKKQMQEARTRKNVKIAVDRLCLTARPGEIYGLLGPNGAGKTTALRCLATILKPSEGSIAVSGFDPVRQPDQVRRIMGFLTNEIKLDPQFTPGYLFRFFGNLHGVGRNVLEARKKELFSYFGITDFENKKIEDLSTGMKQKAAIAISLVHDPQIIIFDEPTNGLDIITARSVTDYLKKLRDEGKLVMVSTHIMSEAQKLCDRIGIIIDGKKVIEGTPGELLLLTKSDDLEDAFFQVYKNVKGE